MTISIPTQIGVAPLFYTDFPTEDRLKPETKLNVIARGANWSEDVCLFLLPEHIRKKWWSLAVRELLPNEDASPDFKLFIDSFKSFAHFKGLPILETQYFDVLVRAPLEPYTINDVSTEMDCRNAVVNLGDESTQVIFDTETILLKTGDGCWVPKHCHLELDNTMSKIELDVLLQIWHLKIN